VYQEQGADSTGHKFIGGIANAVVFVCIVTATTILFVILYKYRCMKIMYGWLIGSTTLTLGFFGGTLLYLIFYATNTPIDYFTFAFIVYNFAVVGILAIFWRAPPIVNRAYLIAVSGLMAVFFTFLPEWTTW
jgi:presenilin 1